MSIFIGRERELKLLHELLDKKTASLVVVKGRRRIGKSRLISEFAKDTTFLKILGLPPEKNTRAQDQRDFFIQQMSKQLGTPIISCPDWTDVFWLLNTSIQNKRFIILFDEISWMGSKDRTFLGKLKTFWDEHFKNNPKLILVLCGSISTWIEKNIISATGFMGRISKTITVKDLSLKECNAFWGKYAKKISAYEKLKLLSVTGGIPRYLEEIKPQLSAEQNIQKLCFTKENILSDEFNKIFNDLFGKRASIYGKIVRTLLQGPKNQTEITQKLKIHKSGRIGEYLEDLCKSEFIGKESMWSLDSHKDIKYRQYRLTDNYMRFYLKYIEPNMSKIDSGLFEHNPISSLPGWHSLIGLQFENLVLKNKLALLQLMDISPIDIVKEGPYFQTKTNRREGCQIDYLIQTQKKELYVCEIKFSKDNVKKQVIKEVEEKINKLKIPKYYSIRAVLIHVNGVDQRVIEEDFFSEIIDFGRFLD